LASINASTLQNHTDRSRTRRRAVPVVFLVVLAACSCNSPSRGRAPAQAKLDEARRLFTAKRDRDAIKAADEAAAYDPKWPEPHKFKADVLNHSSHFRQAFEELMVAYRLDPEDVQAALAVLGSPGYAPAAELEPIARKAVSGAPDNPLTNYYLGLTLEGCGPSRYAEAMESLQKARQLGPDAILPMIEVGKLSCMVGDETASIGALEKAVARLNEEIKQGDMSPDKLEDWLQLQRSAFFWLSQAYRRKGDAALADKAAAVAARLSATTATLRTLKDRAAARPDDQDTKRRLKSLLETGHSD